MESEQNGSMDGNAQSEQQNAGMQQPEQGWQNTGTQQPEQGWQNAGTQQAEQNRQNTGTKQPKMPKHMKARTFWGGFLAGALVMLLALSAVLMILLRTGEADALLSRWDSNAYGAVSGNAAGGSSSAADGSAVNTDSVSKLQMLENMIGSDYYYADDVTQEQKEDGIYKGLISSLNDPYSTYYTSGELKDLNAQTQGVYYGIGAYVSLDEKTGYPLITGTVKNSPAEAAGIQAGDIIYEVNGANVDGKDLDEVVSLIRGEAGTSVHLTLYREGAPDYIEIDVTRAKLDSDTVYHEMKDGGIGYIGITEFDDVTSDQFAAALADLKKQNMKGLIIDLRGNPGGNVSAVTAIAQQILPKGLIFYWKDRDGKKTEFSSDGTQEFKLPMTVLVNDYSASASEILSGAIQDSGIGTLIGTQTYGKGVVQDVFDLKDGTAVKLTVAAYFTRNGRDINHVGITPDIVLPFDTETYQKSQNKTDNQLDEAMKVIQEKLDGTFDAAKEKAAVAAESGTASSALPAASDDSAGAASTEGTPEDSGAAGSK